MSDPIASPQELGAVIRRERRALGLRLEDLALAAGVGMRFLSELERGKATVQLDRALRVIRTLGLHLELHGTDDEDA
ncbi:MAG TPA: helix-turn-helix domain-containing protein [Conexibacter sp.]|nr:helix-turn-helix domain-containing protein [Conexibacter sp.]